ncbi:MAG: VWA containing CoxE family protein [Oscillospiraceae bacterium]
MFNAFFFLLRARGIEVSLNEWLTLYEALKKGLASSSLSGFYYLCRAVLVHSEADFDKYDQVFLEYFKGLEFTREIPQEVLDWLDKPFSEAELRAIRPLSEAQTIAYEEVLKMLEERLEEQTEEHNFGSYWVGTRGKTPFGNNGKEPGGVRVGGRSKYRSAFQVAGERRFRDFREDKVLDNRSFQMALRSLRQFSTQIEAPKTELDLDQSIKETGDNAGHLKLVFQKPRKNAVKLLLLMDSGGSIDDYRELCTEFFSAVTQTSHFKDLSIYYFHNCIDNYVYTSPTLSSSHRVETQWLMNNYGADYKVIIIGDAEMHPWELQNGSYFYISRGDVVLSPLEWLRLFRRRHPHLVWLAPQPEPPTRGFWGQTYHVIKKEVPMYRLTIEGLQAAFRRLMVAR